MDESKTAQTIAAYNRSAHRYAETFSDYAPYRRKMAAFQRKYIPPGAAILDLGCGPGTHIKTIAERDDGCRFTGVDLSARFIAMARQAFPQFVFLERDIRQLELAGTFDVVLASFCIVHLADEEVGPFIRSAAGFLVANGHLYLSFMEGDRDGFETTSFSDDHMYFNYYRTEFILDILAQNGLKPLELSSEAYREPDGSTTNDVFIFARKTV